MAEIKNKLTVDTSSFRRSLKEATSDVDGLKKGISGMASIASVIGITLLGNDLVKTTANFQGLRNQINFASGSAYDGGKNFEWIRQESNKLGLDLQTSAEAFAKFAGAARGSAIDGEGVKDVFHGASLAVTAMHLSADDASGVFLALQQMLSKGKVSAEELNRQLGDRLPGAFGIASRAMGVTQKELIKMMKAGELMSEEFLPKFAAQLKYELGDAAETSSTSLTASINRMNNSFLELKITLGELLIPAINDTIAAMTSLGSIGQGLIEFYKEHTVLIKGLAGFFGTLLTAILLYRAKLLVVAAAQWVLNSATAFFVSLAPGGVLLVAAAGATALAVGIYAASNAQDELNKKLGEFDYSKETKTLTESRRRQAQLASQIKEDLDSVEFDDTLTKKERLGKSNEAKNFKLLLSDEVKHFNKLKLDNDKRVHDANQAKKSTDKSIAPPSQTETVRENITINVAKFMDSIKIYPATLKESQEEIQTMIIETFQKIMISAGEAK
jgi:tape measure domain-containing protein